MNREEVSRFIDGILDSLKQMSDQIFDYAELSGEEYQSSALLEDFLESHGFAVERGIAGLPTAFRAVYQQGEGGPSFGLLAEYDALSMGHGCGHHMQGPAIAGAALCIRELAGSRPCRVVVYGTPAEEAIGGKIIMQEKGCFQDIDIALMMHASPTTCVDVKCMALEDFRVTFRGVSAHAAIAPDKGRSALDAALLSFQGIEFMREHVPEDTRMHYTILDAGGPANVVPEKATAEYTLRSYSTDTLKGITSRFYDVIKGAALMAGVQYDMERDNPFMAKIPCRQLNDLVMKYAAAFEAPRLSPPREKTGSTDFGNVMYFVPGTCIRIAFAKETSAAHSQDFLDDGKTENARRAISLSAKILAAACLELLEDPAQLTRIREEFDANKKAAAAAAQV